MPGKCSFEDISIAGYRQRFTNGIFEQLRWSLKTRTPKQGLKERRFCPALAKCAVSRVVYASDVKSGVRWERYPARAKYPLGILNEQKPKIGMCQNRETRKTNASFWSPLKPITKRVPSNTHPHQQIQHILQQKRSMSKCKWPSSRDESDHLCRGELQARWAGATY